MISTITISGQTINVVSVPTSPGLKSVDWSFSDAVAVVGSPWTGQNQRQSWPGADRLSATCTLPPLKQAQADDWISFLMECRGQQNAFLLGDPMKPAPTGVYNVLTSTPVADNVTTPGVNVAMSQLLMTRGWRVSTANLLRRGDLLQIGYRLHRVLANVSSDASGNATVPVWPSLREAPADGAEIVLTFARGLFALSTNSRAWSIDQTRLSRLSFPITEYR